MRVGIFDSGFGGLTIYRAIRERLPQYDYVYLGDNARTPYGHRSFETVFRFTAEAVRFLFARDCALVVIACNTASAKALRTVQQTLLPVLAPQRRVLGIIRPSVEALAAEAATSVALWATPGTVSSDSYALELRKLRPELRLVQVACPLLVPLVENGELQGAGLDFFVRKYWRQTGALAPSGIDALLLACTHYPLLLPRIREIVPPQVRILSQGAIVAPSLADYLHRHPEIEGRLSRGASTRFLTSDVSESFDRLAELFLGHAVSSERVEIEAPAAAEQP